MTQAHRECLSRRQHRLRQRAVPHRREDGRRRLEVIRLANRHPRVNILSPGSGKWVIASRSIPWFLVSAAPEQTPPPCTSSREVNDGTSTTCHRQAAAIEKELPRARRLPGLAFKAKYHRRFPRKPGAQGGGAALARRFGERASRSSSLYARAARIDGTAELIDVDSARSG